MNKVLLLILLTPCYFFAQSFAPEPGQPGSTAIHKDSSIFIDWASDATITRGYMNILNPSAGLASYGSESDASGQPDGVGVVSLGDSGVALLTFSNPIIDGPGADFAVFENGFIDHYMELAFVEVSSDGLNFVRFNGISEIPLDVQMTNFSTSNCAYVHNLAGKYRSQYGTPFDLEELNGSPFLDLNNILYVRIIDVIGYIDSAYASYDSQGDIINDPFPTEFPSGGFDLDGVGVIHNTLGLTIVNTDRVALFPNPTEGKISISVADLSYSYEVYDMGGRKVTEGTQAFNSNPDLSEEKAGLYFIHLQTNDNYFISKVVKK